MCMIINIIIQAHFAHGQWSYKATKVSDNCVKQVNEHTQTSRYFSINGSGAAAPAGAPGGAVVTTHRPVHIGSHNNVNPNSNYAKV